MHLQTINKVFLAFAILPLFIRSRATMIYNQRQLLTMQDLRHSIFQLS